MFTFIYIIFYLCYAILNFYPCFLESDSDDEVDGDEINESDSELEDEDIEEEEDSEDMDEEEVKRTYLTNA